MLRLCVISVALAQHVVADTGAEWTRIGPWNIFDGVDPTKSASMGEAGTLASAASPAANPNLIYAGGQNNGVSSGVLKTLDGGVHWTRNSKGMWDTRVLGVWVHPDDPRGSHVLCGTHSGIYESTDAAESWQLNNETKDWGSVMSFREALIAGKPYIVANGGNGWILTRPLGGGQWQQIKAPGGMASNMYLSVVITAGKTELLTCIGGWGGGKLYYGALDTPTAITWDGPLMTANETYTEWAEFPNFSAIWGKCSTPTTCNPDVQPLGKFENVAACKAAVNGSHDFPVASWTYQHPSVGGGFGGQCYVVSTFSWEVTAQTNVDSGRAPGTFPGAAIDCANAAVDPNDRNHFMYSKGGQYRAWHSEDGGKTVSEYTNHDTGVYFVMIDEMGWMYTATQAGAFVSEDKGLTWNPYHVRIVRRNGQPEMDRVPHDYQNIVPNFRGHGIAFPSDQGLHIVNRSNENYTLISAVGDLHNTMSLSALISPSKDGKSRNIVSNIWDWDVAASWDDGATWAGWAPGEKDPGSCGEGGGGTGMGASPYQIMFHHSNWYASADGGHNFIRGDTPGTPGGGFDYVRQAGSRTWPSGTCFAMLDAPADYDGSDGARARARAETGAGQYTPNDDDSDDEEPSEDEDGGDDELRRGIATGFWYDKDDAAKYAAAGGTVKWMMISTDFGASWTWTQMPASLQTGGFVVDPTSNSSLYTMTDSCLSHSTNNGKDWSACNKAAGLTGSFSKLIIKNSMIMFMLRNGAVPLRTRDGGSTWAELTAAAPLFEHGATLDGSLSWSGKTLVLLGTDLSAIGRGAYGTAVWKSTDDGDSWADETGDLVTISPGPGVWYENDFYFVTRGEGICVKRDFESAP